MGKRFEIRIIRLVRETYVLELESYDEAVQVAAELKKGDAEYLTGGSVHDDQADPQSIHHCRAVIEHISADAAFGPLAYEVTDEGEP